MKAFVDIRGRTSLHHSWTVTHECFANSPHSWTGHETFVEVTHPFELSRIDSGSVGVQRIERWTPSIGSEDHQRRPCTIHICTIHICTTHICTTALLHIICTHTHLYTYTSIHHVICTTALLYCTHLHIPPPPPTNHHPCALHLHSTCRWSHLTCTCTCRCTCTCTCTCTPPALHLQVESPHLTCTAPPCTAPTPALHCAFTYTALALHCTYIRTYTAPASTCTALHQQNNHSSPACHRK